MTTIVYLLNFYRNEKKKKKKKKRNSDFITLILVGLRTTDSIAAIIIQENSFNIKATFCVHLLIYTS